MLPKTYKSLSIDKAAEYDLAWTDTKVANNIEFMNYFCPKSIKYSLMGREL
jgi:hypothetical protein